MIPPQNVLGQSEGQTDGRTNRRTEVKQYTPLRWSGGIKTSLYHARVTMSMIEICMYSYQKGSIWIPLTSLTLQHFHAFPKPGPGIPTLYVVVFLGVQRVTVRGGRLLFWYCWNCWPSLFKLYFHICRLFIHTMFLTSDIESWFRSLFFQEQNLFSSILHTAPHVQQ